STAYGLGTVASGWLLGRLTDAVIVPAVTGDEVGTGPIGLAGGLLAAVPLVAAAGVAGRRVYAGITAVSVQAEHRRRVTAQYVRLPMSWHRRHPTGRLLANAHADAEAASDVFN